MSSVAVATDGRILACYRMLPLPAGRAHALGDVASGFTNEAALALFASLHPSQTKPDEGDCASCEAHDGCTHFCPALGLAMRGDAHAVPASVCALMRAAVEGVRASLADAHPRPVSRRPWAAAAVVAATVSSLGCGGTIEPGGGVCPSGGGICAVAVDAGGDDGEGGFVFADAGGGICPVQLDASLDDTGVDDAQNDSSGGGLCPAPGIC